MKVNIIGDYFSQTGYAVHTKNLSLALNKLCEVSVSTGKFPGWVSVVNDEEYKMLNNDTEKADVNIMIGLPPYWSYFYNKTKPFVGFLVWEGDKIPNSWIEHLLHDNVKQIWVASQHTKDAILKTGLGTDVGYLEHKIKVVPHGVNTNIFKPDKTKKQSKFTFIANKGWRGGWLDRGGLAFLFKAFNEEFNKDEDVELLVKINSVYAQLNLQEEMNKLKLNPDKAQIKLTPDNLPYEVLPQFYNMGHVFVSPTMSEAFNLPCLEAMACGIPVITTNFGGQTDYVNEENGWILKEGTLFEVKHDILYEGIQWKKPSIEEIRKVLRQAYNNREEVEKKAELALKDSAIMTWDNSAKKAFECLKEINF